MVPGQRTRGPRGGCLGAARRLGRAPLVARGGIRAHRYANESRSFRPDTVREVLRRGSGRPRLPGEDLREPDRGPTYRLDRVHGHADAQGRDPLRADRYQA